MPDHGFTDATVIAAEGQRVGFVTCLECGAAVLLDGRDSIDRPAQHRRWHATVQINPLSAFLGDTDA